MILLIIFYDFFVLFKYWIVLVHSTYVNFLLLEMPLAFCLFEDYIIDTLLLDLKIIKNKQVFVSPSQLPISETCWLLGA